MNTKKNRKSFIAILFSFLLILTVIAVGGGILAPNLTSDQNTAESPDNGTTISAQAATVTYPDGEANIKLGRFSNGSTYAFTDASKVDNYRKRSITSDLTKITVNSSATSGEGSQANPYVIATTDDWEWFVKKISLTADGFDYGAGKYFVLVNDLDFGKAGAPAFHPAYYFKGTFYGMGHKLKNISIDTWQYYNNSSTTLSTISNATWYGFGAFCRITGATITDLIVEDYSYKDMPTPNSTSARGSIVGGVVGYSDGTSNVLNCHTSGEMTSKNSYSSNYGSEGGIVGHGVGSLTLYRCSSEFSMTLAHSTKNAPIPGGILGVLGNGTVKIYDCAANVYNGSTTQDATFGGVAIGWNTTASAAAITVENVVGTVTITDTKKVYGGGITALANGVTTPTIKNVYGNMKSGGNVMYACIGSVTVANTVTTISNVNIVKSPSDSYVSSFNSGCGNSLKNLSSVVTVHETDAAMLAKAKASIGATAAYAFHSGIWDADKIGGTYDPDNSPVRHYLPHVPTDTEFTYKGEAWSIADASWFSSSVHGNTDIMTVDEPSSMINVKANGYSVTFDLKSGYTWNDGTTGSKTIKVKVTPKMLTLGLDEAEGGIKFYKITGGLAAKDVSNPPEIINTYYYDDGSDLPGGFPTTKGDYMVKATIAEGGNYKIKEEGEADPSRVFELTAIPVKTPTVSGELSRQYTGEDIEFTLANDGPINDGKILEISEDNIVASTSGASFTYSKSGTTRKITVKKAGTYTVRFTLADQTNNCWDDAGGVLRLNVTQRPLNLTVERENGKSWTFETNTQETFVITHDAYEGDENHAGDKIQLAISYVKPNGEVVTVGSDKIVTEGRTTRVTLDSLDTFDGQSYTLRVGIAAKANTNDNGNYALTKEFTQDFTVVGKHITITEDDIVWRYSDGQSLTNLTPNMQIPYANKMLTVSIDTRELADKGVQVLSYENETGLAVDSYETSVTLTKLDSSYEFEDTTFTINWSIVKAKFDLTNVKWNYEGTPFGYTGGWITVKLLNVPQGLTAKYRDSYREQQVTNGGTYTAKVQFECDNENYELPLQGKPDTYIYPSDKTFPWELQWEIAKGVIEINWDFYGDVAEDMNGKEFYYPTLMNDRGSVKYVLYKAIHNGGSNYTVGAEVQPNEIEVKSGERVYYYVEAQLTDAAILANNFTLENSDNNPMRFSIGENKTPVKITITQIGGTYDGTPKPIDFTFSTSQTLVPLTKNSFVITYFDEDGNLVMDEDGSVIGAPINAGKYKARLSITGDAADDYYIDGRITIEFEIDKFSIDPETLKWSYEDPFVYTRTGGADGSEVIHSVKLLGLPSSIDITYTNNEFSAVGKYTATASIDAAALIATGNYVDDFDLPTAFKTLKWEVKARELATPQQGILKYTYGSEHDIISEFNLAEDWESYMTVSVKKGTVSIGGTTIKDAGTYSVSFSILGSVGKNAVWDNKESAPQTRTVIISPRYIKVIGWQGKPSLPVFDESDGTVLEEFYKIIYTNVEKGHANEGQVIEDPNSYLDVRFRTTLEVPENMVGNVFIIYDGSIDNYDEFIIFGGAAQAIAKPELLEAELEYNFDEQTFVIKNWKEYKKYLKLTEADLTVDKDFIGAKALRVELRGDVNVVWDDGTTDPIYITLRVVPIKIAEKWVWDDEKKTPVLSFEGIDVPFDITESVIGYSYYEGEKPVKYNKLSPDKDYLVYAVVQDDYAKYFCFGYGEDNEALTTSEGYDFTFGKPDQQPADNETKEPVLEGPENREDTTSLPLWQLIVGGVSAVLFVFCSLKAFGEYGKLKAAKKEAKELAAQSYATTYGFAPLGLLAVGPFLGMEESSWTIIAFVALGLFLVSAVALFMLSKKRKAAELVVKREQARIAEEKEFAREEEMLRREEQHREEQARRDNEMKMMFAAMQQGGYGQASFQYDDMRSMLAETMQALLPAAMQQMQALPPAQSDPNAYAQPNYGAPVDNARSQKEDMLLERLARQEELINQLLQNQQAQQNAPVYEEEEEPVDDISWLGESDEVVSLEESYGALSDEAKRAYYEIGSYIMSKPRTSQNDGRYAVLFKYRRRTLFKLCIKDDAPVLYYPEGSGRGEIRIADAASLGLAKSMIDRNVARLDSELN